MEKKSLGQNRLGTRHEESQRPNLKTSRAKEEEDDDDDAFNRSVIDTVSLKKKLFFLSCLLPQTEKLGPSCCGFPQCIALGSVSVNRPVRLKMTFSPPPQSINTVTLTMVTPLHVLSNIQNTRTIKAIIH
jgi:hypothetical protein